MITIVVGGAVAMSISIGMVVATDMEMIVVTVTTALTINAMTIDAKTTAADAEQTMTVVLIPLRQRTSSTMTSCAGWKIRNPVALKRGDHPHLLKKRRGVNV